MVDKGEPDFYTVLALPRPDGRQFLAVRQDDLLGEQWVLPGQRMLRLTLVVCENLAFVGRMTRIS